MRRPWSIAWVALVCLGCRAPKPLAGNPCVYASDCEEGLTCVYGTCRFPCREDRDCIDGYQCVTSQLPERRACVSVQAPLQCALQSDCPAWAMCAGRVCRRPCAASTDCGEGTCDVPEGSARGGVCSTPVRVDERRGDGGVSTDAVAPSDAITPSDVVTAMDVVTPSDVVTPTDGGAFPTVCVGGVCSTFESVVVARDLVLARRTDHNWYGWGGPLDGTSFPWSVAPSTATRITALDAHNFVVASSTESALGTGVGAAAGMMLQSVGVNTMGRLGDHTTTTRNALGAVFRGVGGGMPVGDGLLLAFGAVNGCLVVGSDRTVGCWGDRATGVAGGDSLTGVALHADENSQIYRMSAAGGERLVDAQYVGVGSGFACALVGGPPGDVWCWGSNGVAGAPDGALGNGVVDARAQPRASQVSLPAGATALQVAKRTACAIVSGDVWCWGSNQDRLLGDGVAAFSATPVHRSIHATHLALGGDFACVTDETAALRCWGRGADHRLATAASTDQSDPVAGVDALGAPVRARTVTATLQSACALCVDDRVRCWGRVLPGGASTMPVEVPF